MLVKEKTGLSLPWLRRSIFHSMGYFGELKNRVPTWWSGARNCAMALCFSPSTQDGTQSRKVASSQSRLRQCSFPLTNEKKVFAATGPLLRCSCQPKLCTSCDSLLFSRLVKGEANTSSFLEWPSITADVLHQNCKPMARVMTDMNELSRYRCFLRLLLQTCTAARLASLAFWLQSDGSSEFSDQCRKAIDGVTVLDLSVA